MKPLLLIVWCGVFLIASSAATAEEGNKSSLAYDDHVHGHVDDGPVTNEEIFDDILEKLYVPAIKSQTFPWPDSAWINHYDLFSRRNHGGGDAILEGVGNSTECLADLLHIIGILKRGRDVPQWLLSMLDAAGKPPSGLLRGGMNWPGYFRECQEVNASSDNKNAQDSRDFVGQYCSAHWQISVNSTTTIPMSTGLCVPSSCSSADLEGHLGLLELLLKKVPGIKPFLNHTKLKDIYCHPGPEDRHYDGPAKACLAVLGLFVAMAIIGTVVDFCDEKRSILKDYKTLIEDNQSPSVHGQDEDNANERKNSTSEISSGGVEIHVEDEHVVIRNSPPKQTMSIVVDALKSFSIRANAARLFAVKKSRNEISCVHGIRFLSMCWIILGHTYVFPILMIENLLDTFKDIDNFPFYTVMNGSFSVDSFFVLSGFLLSYLFFTDCRRTNGESVKKVRFWICYVLHRLWRLTPAYAMVLWINTSVAHYASAGPFWDYGDQKNSEHTTCTNSWWMNLLYVNNFQNLPEQCMAWSWYLANDMQFYLISPVFLLPLLFVPMVGIILTGLVIVGTAVATWLLSYYNHIDVGFQFESTDFNEQSILDYFNVIYTKPWCRVGAYLVGILVGYIISDYTQKKYLVKRSYVWAGWAVAAALLLSPLYGSYHVNFTNFSAAFYNSLSRLSWAAGLGLVLYLAITSSGNVDKFLSWSFWVPLSRLTFVAYLIHPILINLFYRSLQKGIMFSHLEMFTYYGGALAWVYLVSIVFFLLIESPLVSIERVLCRARK